MKKVTIITGTYNLIKGEREEVFKEMLKSVYSQTYKNIEHLIIDGASDDGTLDLIDKLTKKQKNVRVISEPDKGIYDAMNKGIKKATGDYLIILNSDDHYTEDNAIELLVEAIEKNDAEFSVADSLFHNKFIYKANVEIFVITHPFIHNTFLAKKELYKKYGNFDLSYEIGADYDLIYRFLRNNLKYEKVDKVLTILRDGGFSTTDDKKALEETKNVLEKNLNMSLSKRTVNTLFKNRNKIPVLTYIRMFCFIKAPCLKECLISAVKNKKIKIDYSFFSAPLKNLVRGRFILKPLERLIKGNKITKSFFYKIFPNRSFNKKHKKK
ncbi:MAG: hypothetical protein B6I23_01420 [Rickettsiaceae bacterium 4572_127]|nr:MAG: hypothetical protein B6I23_01420 [Rickettsiaceae bacterium 4572_127]